MLPPWPAHGVAVLLPNATVTAMFERAEQVDIERSDRFDRRSASVLI